MVFRHELFKRYRSFMIEIVRWFTEGAKGEAEEVDLDGSSEIDAHIVKWTIGTLSEDDALEEFLEAIPVTMGEFLNRTLSSNTLSTPVKIRRLTSCLNTAGDVKTSNGCWL